jgi:flavodoxin
LNAGHDYANTSIGNLIARTMLSTIALLSSSRRLGNTGRLIDRIAAELNIEIVDLGSQRISPYDYDHLNRHDEIIVATPIYWYAVSPGMKVFLDRISDLLELPDLLSEGRRLRGKKAYVVCTSTGNDPSAAFVDAFRETFHYLGMHLGGVVHVNCQAGYLPAVHDSQVSKFAARVREAIAPADNSPP